MAQTCSLDLPMEIGREQKKTLMFELEPIPAFSDPSFSKNQTRLAMGDRITNNSPFFEGRDARLAVLASRFSSGRAQHVCWSLHLKLV
jgi:hypothetical protein